MGRKNLLADLIDEAIDERADKPDARSAEAPSALKQPTLGNRGAVGAMGRSLEQLSAEREAARAMTAQLASGQIVLEIDPSLIENSIVPDRMMGDDADLASLVDSIRSEGQIVPTLLRPHPETPGRYQIAYGHRRVRALRELGRPVRAVVRELSDDELVIAQGKENGDRQDLTFIERARYAVLLEDRGFKRDTIMAALSVDKTELSRMISTARSIPATLADAIGRAPKIGRRRWIELAERLDVKSAIKTIGDLPANERFRRASSDERFAIALAAISAPRRMSKKPTIWTAPDGKKVAKIARQADRFVMALDEKLAPTFGEFMLSRLPELYEEFRRTETNGR